jgi:hypothetical protein
MSQPAATVPAVQQPLRPGAGAHQELGEFVDVDLGQQQPSAAAAGCSSAIGRFCGAIRDQVLGCLFSCLLRPPCDDRNED